MITLWLPEEECSRLAVKRVGCIRVEQELRQEDVKHVEQICECGVGKHSVGHQRVAAAARHMLTRARNSEGCAAHRTWATRSG